MRYFLFAKLILALCLFLSVNSVDEKAAYWQHFENVRFNFIKQSTKVHRDYKDERENKNWCKPHQCWVLVQETCLLDDTNGSYLTTTMSLSTLCYEWYKNDLLHNNDSLDYKFFDSKSHDLETITKWLQSSATNNQYWLLLTNRICLLHCMLLTALNQTQQLCVAWVVVKLRQNRKIRTAAEFPPTCMARSCSHVQLVSSCVDLTNVMWTPSERCVAEQSMQTNTPYVTLAQVGFIEPQSKHCWQPQNAHNNDFNLTTPMCKLMSIE